MKAKGWVGLGVAVLLLGWAAGSASATLMDSAYAFYYFNDATGTTDDSGHGHNMTLRGGANITSGETGKLNITGTAQGAKIGGNNISFSTGFTLYLRGMNLTGAGTNLLAVGTGAEEQSMGVRSGDIDVWWIGGYSPGYSVPNSTNDFFATYKNGVGWQFFNGTTLAATNANAKITAGAGFVWIGESDVGSWNGDMDTQSKPGTFVAAGLWNSILTPAEMAMVIPEPATLALMGLGGLAMLIRRRRK